jgi:tetratricopeptide (TPR) repeat protein
MKTSCKEYSEKIIFLDDLDEKEKEIVQSHLKECKDCQLYFENVTRIMHSLKSTSCSTDEQLTRFIISENFPGESDFDGEKLPIHETLKIKSHLQGCRLCGEKYEEMRTEFKALESFVDESIMAYLKLGKNSVSKLFNTIRTELGDLTENLRGLLTSPQRKFVFISVTAIAVLLVMILFPLIFTNSGSMYHKLGKLENTEISFLTRGAGAGRLQQGVSEFNNGNYSLAAEELESFILEHSGDPNQEIAEYVCGLAYLFQANKNLDKQIEPLQYQNIETGIQHLQTVLSISANRRLQEDSNWYIGKAYLMKGDGSTAVEYFEKVQNSRGRKAQKAKEILLELKK